MKFTRNWIFVAVVALLAIPTLAPAQSSPEVALRAAMETETVKGDLMAAIEQYKKVAQSGNRAVAAQALLRMAECYQKLGDPESRKVYERIVREFGDQPTVVAAARARLGGAEGKLTKRLLHDNCAKAKDYLSPDARWLAMTDWNTGDIATCDTSTGQLKRLFIKPNTFKESDGFAEGLVLSSDLRQIVYNWDDGTGAVQLRIVANETNAKPRVLVDTRENIWYEPAGFHPDGKSVIVSLTKKDQTSQYAKVSPNGEVKVIKFLGWRKGDLPRLSPDGKYIAYSALAVNPSEPAGPNAKIDRHIYILAANGTSEVEVVLSAGMNDSPIWTPDGKHILFKSDRTGSFGLWSLPVSEGKAAGPASLIVPEIGNIKPVGMRASSYYYSERTAPIQSIAIVDAKPGAAVDEKAETFVGLSPRWSPDGKSISFKRPLPGGRADEYALVVRTLETGKERIYPRPNNLTYHGGVFALWLHDSKGILAPLEPPPMKGYRVDITTGEYEEVRGMGFALSGDDHTIYRLGNRDEKTLIWSTNLITGEDRRLYLSPEGVTFNREQIALSPDGRAFAFSWIVPSPESMNMHLARVSEDGTGFREIYTGQGAGGAVRWSPDGRSILFAQRRQGNPRIAIMQIPAEGGSPVRVTSFDGGGFDISPDGSRIAVAIQKDFNHLVALDNILSLVK